MNGKQARQGKKAQAMNKVYIQVQELLREYGVPFDELLQLVKSGKLALYDMTRRYEYEAIASFDCYVDDYIARKRESLERQYTYNITHIHYPSERIARANALCQSIRERYQGQREIRQIGVDEIIRQNHDKAMRELTDREGVARKLAVGLFLKTSDYENIANSGNSPRKKREAPEIRIKDTLEACLRVETLRRDLLPLKPKKDVFIWVKEEMNYREPYRQTFNEWYTNCPYTRKAGNPNLTKKPV